MYLPALLGGAYVVAAARAAQPAAGGAGMTLVRYLLRGFLRTLLAVFLVIALVIVLFTSVENLRRFGESGAGAGDILRITLLQAPEILYQVFPLVLMLASLATFLRLARTSELVVMRAAGDLGAAADHRAGARGDRARDRLHHGGEPLRRRLDQARSRARGRFPRLELQPALLLARGRLAAPGRSRQAARR